MYHNNFVIRKDIFKPAKGLPQQSNCARAKSRQSTLQNTECKDSKKIHNSFVNIVLYFINILCV